MKTLTPLGARSTGYLRLPALGRGRPPSHHGTCLPRALPTETLPERDSRQDPIERPNPNPNTPPTSKDAADGGSPLKRCGHLTAALTELAAAPEMAIDQGFYVGLDGIEPSTSALSVLLSSQTAPPLSCGYLAKSGLCGVSCLRRVSLCTAWLSLVDPLLFSGFPQRELHNKLLRHDRHDRHPQSTGAIQQ